MKNRIAAAVVLLLLSSVPLLAWGESGHLMANGAAVLGAPPDMPHFFLDSYSELVYLGPDPDRWRNGGESLDALNPPDHFLDYEYVVSLQLPAQRYAFLSLLESSRTLRRYSISNTTAGFLPWRIAEVTELLTVQWRLWRSSDDPVERGQIEQNIIQLAGILGHYAADAANPHHTTIHYNGWVGHPNPQRFRNDCDSHSRFESQFVSRAVVATDVYPLMSEPRTYTDYFAASVEFIRNSNALVETLYALDRDGAFDSVSNAEGRAFAASRLAAGSSFLRDLWWSAWKNSVETPRRRTRS